MSSLVLTIIALLGVIQSAQKVSGTEEYLTVKPGNNITLYCDCTGTTGAYIYWYRNRSNYRQPSFVISTTYLMRELDNPLNNYDFKWNSTSQSHDLLIKNITESELGMYYCFFAKPKVIDTTVIHQTFSKCYGNITYKLAFDDAPTCPAPPDGGEYWSLLVILCPVCALLSALISSTCVYCLCRCKTAPVESGVHLKDECTGPCCAPLDIPIKASEIKQKKRHTQFDLSTYSEVVYKLLR